MTIIELQAMSNGAHRNQTGNFKTIPNSWAIVPNNIQTDNFPFGDIETQEINGVLTVTKWTPLDIPEQEPITESITLDERVSALESAVLELALGGAE